MAGEHVIGGGVCFAWWYCYLGLKEPLLADFSFDRLGFILNQDPYDFPFWLRLLEAGITTNQ